MNRILRHSPILVAAGAVTEIERFSDFEKLLMVTTFVVRFVSNLKKSVKKTEGAYVELVVQELVKAEKLWIKYKQSIISSDKLKLEKLKNSLGLFYDEEKFVRLETRMGKQ